MVLALSSEQARPAVAHPVVRAAAAKVGDSQFVKNLWCSLHYLVHQCGVDPAELADMVRYSPWLVAALGQEPLKVGARRAAASGQRGRRECKQARPIEGLGKV